MKRCALLFVLLGGCQTYGAFNQPDTLPAGGIRLGFSGQYDQFRASDERITSPDFVPSLGLGLTDATELDLLIGGAVAEARIKHALFTPGTFALAAEGGLGFFTAYSSHSTAFYAPLSLVAGVRPSDDVDVFLGPTAWAAAGLDPPMQEAGFNRGTFGLLAGGVAGVSLTSPSFVFCPQLEVLTPVLSGTQGYVLQVSLGVGARVR
ncbi:MAG: hypothetical protein JST54_02840 [Deltaproteobacteria bacterium]|nr:hypothetical protein [Deltaproteobacteria bacterium]